MRAAYARLYSVLYFILYSQNLASMPTLFLINLPILPISLIYLFYLFFEKGTGGIMMSCLESLINQLGSYADLGMKLMRYLIRTLLK